MRNLHILILLLLATSCSPPQESVTYNELVMRDGLTFKKFSDAPFTGMTTGRALGEMKNGLWTGEVSFYRENGTLHRELTYEKGVRNGRFVGWCVNGNKQVEVEFNNDRKEGLYKENFCDGAPRIRATFRENLILGDSAKIYFFSGKTEKYFPLLNGQTHGVAFAYRKDGSTRRRVTWENGQLAGECAEYDKNSEVIEQLVFEEGRLIEWKRRVKDNPLSTLPMPLNNSSEQKTSEAICSYLKASDIGRYIERIDPFAGYEINIVE
jgi:antitoxin component YwqK of YwqJK toxin-antitoxin module